jgi:hypothetical protein
MSEKEIIEELQNIKKLLVAQLLLSGVKTTEIEEILDLGVGNFNKRFNSRKMTDRLKEESKDTKQQVRRVKRR